MNKEKKNGFSHLAKKVGLIFGTALAVLSIGKTNAIQSNQPGYSNSGNNNIGAPKESFKPKPMTVLKLNTQNPELSKLIAQHSSHSSHNSHSSHSSHRSHYSSSYAS